MLPSFALPHFAGFHHIRYTAEQARQDRQQWVIENQASESDQAFFEEANHQFRSEETQALREVKAKLEPIASAHYRETEARIRQSTVGGTLAGASEAQVDAYSAQMGEAFPFRPLPPDLAYANTARPQVTYLILPDDHAFVFTGRDAVSVDWKLKLDPGSIGNREIPPLMDLKEGLRVNFDFRRYSKEALQYFLDRIAKPQAGTLDDLS